VLINGTTYTPYGATECLPIANVSGKEILDGFYLKMRKGFGTCLGKVHLGMEVQIFSLNGDDTLGGGPSRPEQWGEICVTGPVMTKKYFKSELKTSQSKFIYQDKIWHRMGDLGYFDQNNNLWFGGRISHRLYVNEQMIAPIPVESLVNFEPQVNRSALVRGAQGPALVIETKHPRALSKKSLQNILQKNIFNIAVENIYTTAHFPVDVRHNIKIDRLQLRRDLMNGKLKEL